MHEEKCIRKAAPREQRNILICFLWVIKNISAIELQQWLRKGTEKTQQLFLECLGAGTVFG